MKPRGHEESTPPTAFAIKTEIPDPRAKLFAFDAQKTMEVCLAADRSAERGGEPVALPLIPE